MVDCKKCKNYGNRCIPAVNGKCDAYVEIVDHPSHYQQEGRKECIVEMEEKFGVKAVYWFCKLNAYKYRYRAGNKDGNSAEQDEAKAVWYDRKADEMETRMKMEMFESLKPCPFCGKKPYSQIVCSNNHVVVRILCTNPDCDVKFKKTLDVGTSFHKTIGAMHSVAALWNTRAKEDEE